MLVCILKVCLVALLKISERGSKYSQVGQNGRSHCVEEASMIIIEWSIQRIACFDVC